MDRGKFIVVEGADGTGKSTLVKYLDLYLKFNLGKATLTTKEPGSPQRPFCVALRHLLFGDQHRNGTYPTNTWKDDLDSFQRGLLLFLDHYSHAKWVKQMTREGFNVISDRWLYSQYAYEAVKIGSSADALDLYSKYEQLQIKPDMTILWDVEDDQMAIDRLIAREKAQEKETSQKDKQWGGHENVHVEIEEYRKLAEQYKTWVHIYQKNGESTEETFLRALKQPIDDLFNIN